MLQQIMLVIISGMTNRRDMIDEALMRPGRLEVQVEIGGPFVELHLYYCNLPLTGWLPVSMNFIEIE